MEIRSGICFLVRIEPIAGQMQLPTPPRSSNLSDTDRLLATHHNAPRDLVVSLVLIRQKLYKFPGCAMGGGAGFSGFAAVGG